MTPTEALVILNDHTSCPKEVSTANTVLSLLVKDHAKILEENEDMRFRHDNCLD